MNAVSRSRSVPWSRMLGLAVVGAALASCVGGSASPFTSSKDLSITAEFDNAEGLYVGNQVAVLGMKIGEVTSIEPAGDHVDVEFTVDGDIPIPADAMAVTVSTSVLTDRHIELTPAYTEGPRLADADHIGLARTRTPISLDQTLAMADELGRSLSGDGNGQGPIQGLVDTGDALVAGNGDTMRTALSQLSVALRLSADNGSATREQLTTIVDNLSVLTAAAAANDATIREFGSTLRQVSDVLADADLGSGTTGKQLNDVVAEAAVLIQNNRDHIKATVANATTITTALVDFRREVSEIFDVLPLALTNVYNAIDQDSHRVRIHAEVDKIVFDSQLGKELCNLLHLTQLGCATGTLADYGPDFGALSILEAIGTPQ